MQYALKVPSEDAGKRLDVFLMDFSRAHGLGLSRTFIQKLIARGSVRVAGSTLLKPHQKIKAGEDVEIVAEKPEECLLLPEEIPLEVVYEDEDVAVVNKQAGLVVHPAPGNQTHTLVNALLYRFKKLSDVDPQRPGIVHRLDKETSGLMAVAKNNEAHLALREQFSSHSVRRTYVAIVRGEVAFDEDVVEMPIQRHPYRRKSMSVGFGPDSRYARTLYRTLKRTRCFSLMELVPFTGRTHQIRVHLAFLGHPILGDEKYGKNNEFPRLALHAKSLGFEHPRTGRPMDFDSELPPEFKEFIGKNMT